MSKHGKTDTGIVTVVSQTHAESSNNNDDEDLLALQLIRPIQRRREIRSPFYLGSIISAITIDPNAQAPFSRIQLGPDGVDSEAIYNALYQFQTHLKLCFKEIATAQTNIYGFISSVSSQSQKVSMFVKSRMNLANEEEEYLHGISFVRSQLFQTQKFLDNILSSIKKISNALPGENVQENLADSSQSLSLRRKPLSRKQLLGVFDDEFESRYPTLQSILKNSDASSGT